MAQLGATWEREELGGGRFRHTQHLRPIAYERNGAMRRIKNALAATGNTEFPVGADELCQFRVGRRVAGQSPLVHFGKGPSFVRLALVGAKNVAGTVQGNQVMFPNAWNNVDLRYTLAGHRLQEDILLRAGHPRSFAFRIDSHVGFDPLTLDCGEFRILQPTLEPPSGSEKMAVPLQWLVTQQGGKWVLTVTLPKGDWAGWTVDPTLTLQPAAAAGIDTVLDAQFPDYNHGAKTAWYIRVKEYHLYKFDLSSIPIGATATAVVHTITQTSANAFGMQHYSGTIAAADGDWIEGTKTGAQATVGEPCRNWKKYNTVTWSTAGLPLITTQGNYLSSNGGGAGTQLPVPWTTPANIQSMFGAVMVNGIAFWTLVNGSGQVALSDHATAAYRPKLVIDYTLAGGSKLLFAEQMRVMQE